MIKFQREDTDNRAELPYVTAHLSGVGGAIRARPEHFEVEELPLYEASGEGEHLYVNITKVGVTTKVVQAELAKLFGLSRSRIGLAGLKDKNARTTQTFSVHVGLQNDEYAQRAAERIADRLGLHVNWARFHRNKLKTGHLLGNRFVIVVTDLSCDGVKYLAKCDAIAAVLEQRGVPNYFGPQRFGSRGDNVKQGLAILRGQQYRRDKWLRRFLVGSVQSHLCNLYLAERVRTDRFDRLISGDVAKKYDTGGMFEVEDLAAEQVRYDAHEISFTAPMFGPKMWESKGDSGELESSLLRDAALSIEEFQKARVSGTRRMGRVLVSDLEFSTHDEGIRLSFSLPKGAYATTVLREFMKNESESLFADDDDDNHVEGDG